MTRSSVIVDELCNSRRMYIFFKWLQSIYLVIVIILHSYWIKAEWAHVQAGRCTI